MDSGGRRKARASLKANASSIWKEKLRQNCLERAKEDRAHLIWKIRSSAQDLNQKDILNSAFRRIVSDELMKIESPMLIGKKEFSDSDMDDLVWEYNGMQVNSYSGEDDHEREDLLIEMERLLYEDLKKELIKRELDAYEEEEEYLAQSIFDQMQLNDDKSATNVVKKGKIWCPICKSGELKEDHQLIYCTHCNLHLDLENDKVNLDVLCHRLGEAYEEHLDRGCEATPSICMEARFKITALYIQCHVCQTFEIIV